MWNKAKILLAWAALTATVTWTAVAKENADFNPLLETQERHKKEVAAITTASHSKSDLLLFAANKVKPISSAESKNTIPVIFSEYYLDIKDRFWEDLANQYLKYAKYFTSIVEEWDQEDIAEYLCDTFKWAWDEELLSDFVGEVEDYLKDWEEIDQVQLTEMTFLLEKVWVALKQKIDSQILALAFNDEIQEADERKIKELKEQILELEQQVQANEQQVQANEQQVQANKLKIKALKKQIEKIKLQIKQIENNFKKVKSVYW